MKVKKETSPNKINHVKPTTETIANRGGLALFFRYLESISFFNLVDHYIGNFQKSTKGLVISCLMKQIIGFFVDGTYTAMAGFDSLRKDKGYAAVLEMEQTDLAGSHMVKRFFRKFIFMRHGLLLPILHALFIWRLKTEKPGVVVLDMDTMVLNNDDALKREGVNPTYKKKKGFQCLNLTWKGRFVSSLFRSGEKHSNHGDDVMKIMKKMVGLIRKKYREDVPILVTCDSGFLSEENLKYFNDVLKIHFICSGKMYTAIKKQVEPLEETDFSFYSNSHSTWAYVDFTCGLDSWNSQWRTIYTSLVDEEGQIRMSFSRPDSVIHTNLGMENQMDTNLKSQGYSSYFKSEAVIEEAHQRGTGELCHRSIKEFMGKEHLPFKRFGMNGAYYYIMLISHFLFETYLRDVGKETVSIHSYPNTVRRKLIDFAAKVISKGGQRFLKVTTHVWESLHFKRLWDLCNRPPIFLLEM